MFEVTILIILIVVCLLLGVTIVNVIFWPKVGREEVGVEASVSILIPARNEEANLALCLESALAQGGIIREVLVYDDHSSDRTPQIIEEYAGRDSRVRKIAARQLEAGWCGKNFACAELAREAGGELLLFIDADARLRAGAAGRMAGEMKRRRLALLSCWPGLVMVGFWERTLMPLLNFIVFTLYPAPASLIDGRPSLGLAHGACLMIERESYRRIGGHGAVRGEIFEDVRLAQLWRERGERSLCLDGREIVGVRMYDSLGEIWRGFQKNFYPAFRRERSFWAFILLHLLVLFAPFPLLASRQSGSAMVAAGGVIVMRALLALRFRHPLWSVLLHPLGELFIIALGLSSWRRCKSGRGVVWKGRIYQT